MSRDNATTHERIMALAPNQARIALLKLAEAIDDSGTPETGIHDLDLLEALDIAESYSPTN